MNKFLIIGTGSLIGAGIGFVVAHLLVERFMEFEYEENSDILESDLEKLATANKRAWKPKEVEIEKISKPRKKKIPVKYDKAFINVNGEKGDLELLASKYNKDESLDDGELVNVAEPEEPIVDEKFPYVITIEEYHANPWKYQQQELRYYSQDDVLTTSEGIPLAEPEKIIGLDALTYGNFNEMVYVVNKPLRGLYSIERLDDSFYKERDVKTKRRKPEKEEEE